MFAAPGGYNAGEAGPEALPLNAKTLGGIGKGIAEATGGLGGDNQHHTKCWLIHQHKRLRRLQTRCSTVSRAQ